MVHGVRHLLAHRHRVHIPISTLSVIKITSCFHIWTLLSYFQDGSNNAGGEIPPESPAIKSA